MITDFTFLLWNWTVTIDFCFYSSRRNKEKSHFFTSHVVSKCLSLKVLPWKCTLNWFAIFFINRKKVICKKLKSTLGIANRKSSFEPCTRNNFFKKRFCHPVKLVALEEILCPLALSASTPMVHSKTGICGGISASYHILGLDDVYGKINNPGVNKLIWLRKWEI